MRFDRPARRAALSALWTGLLVAAACGEPTTPTGPDVVEPSIDLDALFAPATASELAVVREDWASRTPAAEGVEVVVDDTISRTTGDIRVRIVSHRVEEVTHFGALISPVTVTGPLPVVLYAHGGDEGTSVESVLLTLSSTTGLPDFLWLVPSFRDEALTYSGSSWRSGGPASPWDRDVDDALALVDVGLSLDEDADEERVGVLGFSRGGAVGMLAAIRDPRIDRVVSFFGPTDFLGGFVREIVDDLVTGGTNDLPGVDVLEERVVGPLTRGELTIAQARLELVRRSAVLFAEELPALQLHHGTADTVVPVSQAEAMISAMTNLGRGEPEFEATLYDGGGHNPFTLPGSIDATVRFLTALATTVTVR